eukprot:8545740-Pyramimonas_sp.AAC.1
MQSPMYRCIAIQVRCVARRITVRQAPRQCHAAGRAPPGGAPHHRVSRARPALATRAALPGP